MLALSRLALAAALAALPGWSAAHALDGPVRLDLPWSFEPWAVACLVASALAYATGLLRLWRRAGLGRGVTAAQAWAFVLGWLALAAALVSPLDPLGSRLFSAHMLQHELLMVVAAPLLCLGRPLVLWTWALSPAARERAGGWTRHPSWRAVWAGITAPLAAWALHALVLWGWHVPWLFDMALQRPGVHVTQHLSFFGSALLFWWSALQPQRPRAGGLALLSLFTTMVHTGALGALLTLSPRLWYASYAFTAPALGLDALEDQQLGGLVMWVPAGGAYLVAALWLAGRWLRGTAQRGGMRMAPSSRTHSPLK